MQDRNTRRSTAAAERGDARPLYLGVDGGGTGTTAWVSDGGSRVLGRGTAGPSNPVTAGLHSAEREILAAARKALRGAGPGKLQAVCLGVAGGDRPEVSRPLTTWIRKQLLARFHLVTTDAAIALEAAVGESPGIVVIAGTGSIACGRDARGRTLRCGGWGSAFDDVGSGYEIGRKAVAAALRSADGRGPQTRLGPEIAHALGLSTIEEIIGLRLEPHEIAALAPVVIETASQRARPRSEAGRLTSAHTETAARVSLGDRVARRILDEAAHDLAELAVALVRRLGRTDEPLPVVCAGGLFRANPILQRAFSRHLRKRASRVSVSALSREAVEGALTLAVALGRRSPGSSQVWRGSGRARRSLRQPRSIL